MFNDLSQHAADHQGNGIRDRIWRIVFLSDTRAGKAFDVLLLTLIATSITVVMLETVPEIQAKHGKLFRVLEWIFTALFTAEYLLRLWVVGKKRSYLFSFYGIIDFISILPTYLTLFLPGMQYVLVVRVLRLLRVFRVMKMARHLGEANLILNAIQASVPKITVFLFLVLSITVILGTVMYVVEGIIAGNAGFNSVPQSVYWGIVTISTVGYGDVAPMTPAGKFIATLIMLIGYGIIAVPTGIVTAELNLSLTEIRLDHRRCPECGHVGHDPKASFCKMCGHDI
ncbi:MAG: ion transporter [Verrucomicrobiae bacterium]|nr:ion transporter [Verrucomicrobiae bacterium]